MGSIRNSFRESFHIRPGARTLSYIYLFAFCVGLIFWRDHTVDVDNAYLRETYSMDKKVELEGVITSDPEDKKTYWRYEVSIKDSKTGDTGGDAKMLVKEKNRAMPDISKSSSSSASSSLSKESPLSLPFSAAPTYGDHVKFMARISKPKVIESDDGRDFDYQYFLQKDGIFYLADIDQVQTLAANQASRVTYHLYKFKKSFMQNVEDLLPAPYAFLATGLVISGKGSLDKDLQTQFQKVGLIHIVVLSGSNVSIVGEAISKFLSFLPKLWGGIFGSLGIILFGMMTGGGSTVNRSVIMSIIGIYARLSGRRNSGFVSLMFAGTLMLIQNPKLLLHDPSFQLSFMATLAMIFLAGPIEEFLKRTKSKVAQLSETKSWRPGRIALRIISMSLKLIPDSLISLVSTCIATQIFTLPFIIRFSGVVSLVALPVNTIILPFIPFTMLFVFLTGVVCFISPLIAHVPALVSYVLLKFELVTVGYFSSLSFSAVKLPNISPAMFLLSYVLISFLVVFLNSNYPSKARSQIP
jgi:predicted membrane metal-binding protein